MALRNSINETAMPKLENCLNWGIAETGELPRPSGRSKGMADPR